MLISLLVGFIITIIVSFANYTKVYSQNTENDIASKVVRFHVLANSDSTEDQALKIYVKDKILEKYKTQLTSCETREETLAFMNANLNDIQEYAQNLVYEKGYSYDVTAGLEIVQFPTKVYGDVRLPAGKYKALRIQIGSAKGHNWWCVMYPPLCYVDIASGTVSDKAKQQLGATLTTDEYSLVTSKKKNIEVKFKIVEMWNSVFK